MPMDLVLFSLTWKSSRRESPLPCRAGPLQAFLPQVTYVTTPRDATHGLLGR